MRVRRGRARPSGGSHVQGFDESGLSILVNVVEHFSYHVGEITWVVKSSKAVDLRYYD